MAYNEDEYERTESGDILFNYEGKEGKEFTVHAEIDNLAREKMEAHIETYFGPIYMVYHEIISHLIHLDIYHIASDDGRPYHTLITQGMSDLAMNVPEGLEQTPYMELMCFLPPEWDISEEGFKHEHVYWPIENLKTLARLPHEMDTWLGVGHTIQNSQPIEPFAYNTKLCASLIFPPLRVQNEALHVNARPDKIIEFNCVLPLYESEMKYKTKRGTDKLVLRFDKHGITDVYDINRKNVCRKLWF